MSTFGGLDVLFNPAKRHLDEEKLRLQSTREEIGDASGGKRIDLDSGRVKIPRAQANGDETAGADVVGDDPADDPDAPVVATTAATVRTDADADADPAAEVEAAVEVEENTPAARARRRRAKKA